MCGGSKVRDLSEVADGLTCGDTPEDQLLQRPFDSSSVIAVLEELAARITKGFLQRRCPLLASVLERKVQ